MVLGLLGGAATLTLLAMQEDSVEEVLPTPNVDNWPISDEQKKMIRDFKFIPREEGEEGLKHAKSFQQRAQAAERAHTCGCVVEAQHVVQHVRAAVADECNAIIRERRARALRGGRRGLLAGLPDMCP